MSVSSLRLALNGGREKQTHPQAAEALRAPDVQRRAMLVGNRLHDRQPQAAARRLWFAGAVEAIEHALALLGRQARAAVFHHQFGATRLLRDADVDAAALG